MEDVIHKEVNLYRPAIALDFFLSVKLREFLNFIFAIVALISLVLFVTPNLLISQNLAFFDQFRDTEIPFAIFLISSGLFFITLMLTLFHNSFYYRGIEALVHKNEKRGISYEVAYILLNSNKSITNGFVKSLYGQEILIRSGVSLEAISNFLKTNQSTLSSSTLELPQKGFLTIDLIAWPIFKNDKEFSDFLFSNGISEKLYTGAARWVTRTINTVKHNNQWWSKDNLKKIPAIGREWSYGGAYALKQYSRNLENKMDLLSSSNDISYTEEIIQQIEIILSRTKEANVIIVGAPGVGKIDILVQLKQKMQRGEVPEALKNNSIILFDTNNFVAEHNSKESFEAEFIRIFDQVAKAGNIIVAIDDLPAFLRNAQVIGSNVVTLLDRYLTSPHMHIIATSTPTSFHQEIETKPQLAQRFERVQIDNPGFENVIRILEGIVSQYEAKYHLVLTYPAIYTIAESADRYITEGVMPNKAIDLLDEIITTANGKGISVITKDFVHQYVGTKTGIPSGPMNEEERSKLMQLEEILHKRVIGQDAAIGAISSAIRRARTDIQNTKRPMGSFLFLGPTGVGKTETAKALAATFFKNEESILRFDMSEYSGTDALQRLIGESGRSGILANALKDRPYGVLLLDEFEKATTEVHDLFLQILDEGFFSDIQGNRINVRNTIIIATSNAGSDLIWNLTKEGKDPTEQKDTIIDIIIQEAIYKPELLNRFDAVIIFHSLEKEHLKKIANIMLEKLKGRLKKKGYDLVINDVLINLLLEEGYNPQFGARPMQRVMKNKIEEKIAVRIIEGGLSKGSSIEFSEQDF